jgi:glycosyltransferase involved in cell wall biosynthesis
MLLAPKVGVVMSAYNAAAYLDEAVNSILGQTFREFEFIIINSGSSDDTGGIFDKDRNGEALFLSRGFTTSCRGRGLPFAGKRNHGVRRCAGSSL